MTASEVSREALTPDEADVGVWVGAAGLLSDASFASGRLAGESAARSVWPGLDSARRAGG